MPLGALIWLSTDLALAFVPVALAFGIAHGLRRDILRRDILRRDILRRDILTARRIRWELWLPLLLVWLLFLPNTCYLLTEWRHYLCDIHDRSVQAAEAGHGGLQGGKICVQRLPVRDLRVVAGDLRV